LTIRPLIILKASNAAVSGGYYRLYEVLKNGKLEGIDYVIVIDSVSYRNFICMFEDFKEIIKGYKTYFIDVELNKRLAIHVLHVFKTIGTYFRSFLFALSISKIAHNENVDLIFGPSEGTQMVWSCYCASVLSKKPWSALFQGTTQLLQPTPDLGPITLFNALKHVNQKESTKNLSLVSKFGFALELFGVLKIAQNSLILTVSSSMREELNVLNPKIDFHVIKPGNGLSLDQFNSSIDTTRCYDAVFFARFIPEKGIFDLLKIWKLVVKQFPDAKLALAGIIEDPRFVEEFQRKAKRAGLSDNMLFLGQLDRSSVIDLVTSSKITVYPSVMDVFSLVVLESLACGTPVITYDIPAITHNFGNCKAVSSCHVKDYSCVAKRVIFLLENEALREELSKDAKDCVKNFDWRLVVRGEKEAYYKVIEWFNSKKSLRD
jgi:glycosyltransferase involved in cell wall biosynthesis